MRASLTYCRGLPVNLKPLQEGWQLCYVLEGKGYVIEAGPYDGKEIEVRMRLSNLKFTELYDALELLLGLEYGQGYMSKLHPDRYYPLELLVGEMAK